MPIKKTNYKGDEELFFQKDAEEYLRPVAGATLYVTATGNDTTGDGTELNPFRQISRALEYVSGFIMGDVKINVGAGSFEGFTISQQSFHPNVKITIQGSYGVISPDTKYCFSEFGGVYADNYYEALRQSGSDWTLDEWKGKFARAHRASPVETESDLLPVFDNDPSFLYVGYSYKGANVNIDIVELTTIITSSTDIAIQNTSQNVKVYLLDLSTEKQIHSNGGILRVDGCKAGSVFGDTHVEIWHSIIEGNGVEGNMTNLNTTVIRGSYIKSSTNYKRFCRATQGLLVGNSLLEGAGTAGGVAFTSPLTNVSDCVLDGLESVLEGAGSVTFKEKGASVEYAHVRSCAGVSHISGKEFEENRLFRYTTFPMVSHTVIGSRKITPSSYSATITLSQNKAHTVFGDISQGFVTSGIVMFTDGSEYARFRRVGETITLYDETANVVNNSTTAEKLGIYVSGNKVRVKNSFVTDKEVKIVADY